MSIIIIGLLAFLGYALYTKGYFSLQPDGKLYEKNSGLVDKFLEQSQKDLVKFEDDELALLSGNRKKVKGGSFFDSSLEGLLLSIYHEPFLAYKVINHSEKNKTGVMGVATASNVFRFIMKKDHTDVFLDKRPLGTIQVGGKLFYPGSKTEIATFEMKDETEYLIRVGGSPCAELKIEIQENSLPQRILEVFGSQEPSGRFAMRVLIFYLIGLSMRK